MPAVEFPTHPPKPHRGLHPIGWAGAVQVADADAVLFLDRLCRVADRKELPGLLADMHRLIYIGEKFTKAGILRCLRLFIGRTQANWIDGCLDLLAAEEAAQAKAQDDEEDHQL